MSVEIVREHGSTLNPTKTRIRQHRGYLLPIDLFGDLWYTGGMEKIPLTQDKFAIVDDMDYTFLIQWKWCFHNGYAKRNPRKSDGLTKCKLIYMHRVVLSRKLGHSDFEDTDHKNQIKLDNRRGNLRPATRSQDNANRNAWGVSKFKGVSWHQVGQKWRSQIGLQGSRKYLGLFTDEVEAAKAYNKAAIKYFGEFAKLNVID